MASQKRDTQLKWFILKVNKNRFTFIASCIHTLVNLAFKSTFEACNKNTARAMFLFE